MAGLAFVITTCGSDQGTGPPPATQLGFKTEPGTTVSGSTISPLVIEARDASGALVSNFNGDVTIAFDNNPGNGTLSGTLTRTASGGTARFGDLKIDRSGVGYRLVASSPGLAAATTPEFTVTHGLAIKLVITGQPANATAGGTIAPVVVSAQDAQGNVATSFTGDLTLAISAGTGTPAAVLSGTASMPAVAGAATFSTLSIDKSGTGYTLAATGGGLTAATSTPFTIAAGPASELVFSVAPGTTTAGAAIAPALEVTARDALGKTADAFTGDVTVTISAGTGTPGAALNGTAMLPAVAGIATFASLAIDSAGTGYTLSATAATLTAATSPAFDITPGAATRLVITGQPSNTTGGVAMTTAVVVTGRDSVGNTATSFTGGVTLSITPGTGTSGATLSGIVTVTAAAGIATFPTLRVDKAGTGYTLTADAGGGSGIAAAATNAFDVAIGPAVMLGFTTAPGTTVAGSIMTPPIEVAAQDSGGNAVPGFTSLVTLTIGTNPGGGLLAGTTSVTAVAGVATFATLSINKSAPGYTLTATESGAVLPPVTSAPFSIVGGPAVSLLFTAQPGTTAAGTAITPALEVTARDALGNTADGFTGDVTVAISAGTGNAGATLSGTTTVAAVAGVADYTDLMIDKVGSGYTLSATTGGGVAGATSTGFTVIPGAPVRVAFTVQPTDATAGFSIGSVEVQVQDVVGNTVTSYSSGVTVAIAANPGSGTLAGTKTVTASAGVATFSNLSINKSGTGYTLAATAGALAPDTSAAFTIAAGVATQLGFIVQPVTTVAGSPITPSVQVAAQDPLGNTDPGFSGDVTIAIGVNPGGGILSGTMTVTTAAGVADFVDVSIDRSAPGYTLTASTGGLSGTSSAPFTIASGVATQLIFSIQPSSGVAATAITPAVQVTARDVLGNTATGFTGAVTVAITPGSGTFGATLSGVGTVNAVGGVAGFPGINIDKAGTAYTLSATAGGVTDATSGPFDIAIGAASRLAFTVPPVTTTAGSNFTPTVEVSVQDAGGNTVPSFSGNVTVAIGTNPGGGTLGGTKTVAAVSGVAAFSTLTINRSGVGYTLSATGGGLTGGTSPAFTIVAGPAAALVFSGQPTTTTAGAAISPPVQVTVVDALGNTTPTFAGAVTVSIAANPAAGTLSGTVTATAVAGVANFGNLSIDKSGNGYTLSATTAGGPTPATSGFFNVLPGAATRLTFTVQPSTATAGVPIAPSVKVSAQDPFGNTVPDFTGAVSVAITPGTGTLGATLSGATTVGAVAGVATFSLSIGRTGTGYGLTASSGGLTSTASTTFDINPGPASKLVVTSQPANTTAGAAITPPVQITATDALGNVVPSFTDSVTMTIGTNPGSGTLSGTTTVAAVAGVATFSTLSINKTGLGYTLVAAAGTLVDGVSNAFDVVAGAPALLVFTTQPQTTTAGTPFAPAVQVTARDALGNIVKGFTGDVTVDIGVNPVGGTLAGTLTMPAVAGVATFADLSIAKAGTGYRLSAASAGVPTGATSQAFSILAGAVSKLAFTVQPSATTAGATITPPVKVAGQDSLGNLVSTFTGDVTVAITAGTGGAGATLSGTTTATAVSGVATFSTLAITKSGAGYTLTATATALSDGVSAPFTIAAGAAVSLSFTTQPGTTMAGQSIAPAVQVSAQDLLGNVTPDFIGNVTVAIQANPGGGVLTGNTTVAAVGGVATYANLSINKAGSGYTLIASSSGLSSGISNGFTVTAGAPTKLVFTGQPTSAASFATITPAVAVTAQDALGNAATGYSGDVTVAIGSNPANGTLSGTTTLSAVGGIAIFSDLSIDSAGNGYTLTASAAGLTTGTSVAFDITEGSILVFTTQPATTTAGNILSPSVQVTARDSTGNTITSFNGGVTVAIEVGTGTPGATLLGTTTVFAVSGVANFSDLSITKAGTGYRLAATGSGFGAGTSASFAINAGAATKLGFVTEPSTTPAGSPIIPGVQVALQDVFGNTIKGIAGSVTVAIGTNPSGGILSGTTNASFSAGVASFATLSIDQAGVGYTMVATSPGYTDATSATFTITPTASTHLVFTQPPSLTTAGVAIAPAVELQVRDAGGNLVTAFNGTVTVAITAGTGANGAVLSGTKTIQAVGGVATFSDLSIDKAGTGYKLSASASGVAGANSPTFQIVAGAATVIVFSTQPTTTAINAVITPAVEVSARDAFGNVDKNFTANVTVAIAVNPAGGNLSGTKTVAAVQGVATFSTLKVDKAGSGYRLSATTASLTSVMSSAFSITP